MTTRPHLPRRVNSRTGTAASVIGRLVIGSARTYSTPSAQSSRMPLSKPGTLTPTNRTPRNNDPSTPSRTVASHPHPDGPSNRSSLSTQEGPSRSPSAEEHLRCRTGYRQDVHREPRATRLRSRERKYTQSDAGSSRNGSHSDRLSLSLSLADDEYAIDGGDDANERTKIADFTQLFRQTNQMSFSTMANLLRRYWNLPRDCPAELTKLQQNAIPTILNVFKREPTTKKNWVHISGAPKSGKTMGLALSLLTATDLRQSRLQAVVVTPHLETLKELERFFSIMCTLHPLAVKVLFESEKPKRNRKTLQPYYSQLLIAHPSALAESLRVEAIMPLSGDAVFFIDDFSAVVENSSIDDVMQVGRHLCTHSDSQTLRTVIFSNLHLSREYQAVMKELKNGMTKPSMGILSNIQPSQIRQRCQAARHYSVTVPETEWASAIARMKKAMGFPLAIVFADSAVALSEIEVELRDNDLIPYIFASNTSATKAAEYDLLLCTMDVVCCRQILPKVSMFFHLGCSSDVNYGLRLMCTEAKKKDGGLAVNSVILCHESGVQHLEKRYDISFTELPLDFL
eukprot:GEMP01015580.1.p1 GENE.GEMP01015580.1~~GEMP01015580.1.p1  ORF type:complete len:569 (+),score=104.50 GEMP01015580.1:239-1945(+)